MLDHHLPIIIPGVGYEWDSLNHLIYIIYSVILSTNYYHFIFPDTEDDKIKKRIYELDKTGIMGITARIRDQSEGIPRRTFNDIIHCERVDTPIHIGKRKHYTNHYLGTWSDDTLRCAQDYIIEILQINKHLVPLLDNENAICKSYSSQVHTMQHELMIGMYLDKTRELDKLVGKIEQYGGLDAYMEGEVKLTEDYIRRHIEMDCKSKAYDQLIVYLSTMNVKGSIRRSINSIIKGAQLRIQEFTHAKVEHLRKDIDLGFAGLLPRNYINKS